jgi:hypothetical protein
MGNLFAASAAALRFPTLRGKRLLALFFKMLSLGVGRAAYSSHGPLAGIASERPSDKEGSVDHFATEADCPASGQTDQQ